MAEAYTDLLCHDALLVKCSNEKCLRISEISSELISTGLTFTSYDGTTKHNSLDLLSYVSNARFVLVFYCNNLKSSLEKVLQRELISHKNKIILITKTTGPLRNVGEFKRFTEVESTGIIQYIQQTIDSEQERYQAIPQLPNRRPILQLRSQQTVPKEVDDHKLTLTVEDVPSGFINAESFDYSENGHRGIHILQNICLPKGKISQLIQHICFPKGKISKLFQNICHLKMEISQLIHYLRFQRVRYRH